MSESFVVIVGLIASVITIGGFVWFIVKRPLEFRKINKSIKRSCDSWKKSGLSNNSLIDYNNFLVVNRYQDRLNKLDEDQLAFLLRCAVQHGWHGQWGYWAVRNSHNSKAIFPLIRAINDTSWRPRWRAAYILENAFGAQLKDFVDKLPYEVKKSENGQSSLELIVSTNVEDYLREVVSNEKDPRIKEKAQGILHEIDAFSGLIETFRKNRQQKNVTNLDRTFF